MVEPFRKIEIPSAVHGHTLCLVKQTRDGTDNPIGARWCDFSDRAARFTSDIEVAGSIHCYTRRILSKPCAVVSSIDGVLSKGASQPSDGAHYPGGRDSANREIYRIRDVDIAVHVHGNAFWLVELCGATHAVSAAGARVASQSGPSVRCGV